MYVKKYNPSCKKPLYRRELDLLARHLEKDTLDDHVPEAEWNIRLIKRIIQPTFHECYLTRPYQGSMTQYTSWATKPIPTVGLKIPLI
jgi:hypothetical protein